MKHSFFQSETGRFALGLGFLLFLGSIVQVWWNHGAWSVLLPLLPVSLVWAVWILRLRFNIRLLGRVKALAHEVAYGKFGNRITQIPKTNEFSDLCWQMNDMLDQLEACFREQSTALSYAAQGKYFRLGQPTGLRGSFRTSQEAMNQSLNNMAEKVARNKKPQRKNNWRTSANCVWLLKICASAMRWTSAVPT